VDGRFRDRVEQEISDKDLPAIVNIFCTTTETEIPVQFVEQFWIY